MPDPHSPRGIRMLGETVGGQSKRATPGNRPKLPIKRRPDLCPELFGLLDDTSVEYLAGVHDGVLYALSEPSGTRTAYGFSVADLSLVSSVDFDTEPVDTGNFGYPGQGLILPDGGYYQWVYDDPSTEVRLERWTISGGEYTIDDPSVSVFDGEYYLGQTYNPCDGLLYVLMMDFRGAFDSPFPITTVDPSTGTQTPYADNDSSPAPYWSSFYFHHPLLANDGALWVNWTSGVDGGFFRIAAGGAFDDFTFFDDPFDFMPVPMPYGPSSVLAVNYDFGDVGTPWVITSSGVLSPTTSAKCVSFAADVDASKFIFAQRIVYGEGYAWYFSDASDQVWRSPFTC